MKNVYSIVLSSDIVEKIDRLAYDNRSNMINQILAEYVSYTTPEKRFREIFQHMQDMLEGGTFKMLEPSDTMFSLRSALAYKYNPTVKYSTTRISTCSAVANTMERFACFASPIAPSVGKPRM